MKVYLDVCCLCRPFDRIINNRIYLESEAVHAILASCEHTNTLVSSQVITEEVNKISNPEKRNRVIKLLSIAGVYVSLDEEIIYRARIFNQAGLRTFDALHLACAESSHAIFITSDDKLISIIKRNPLFGTIHVQNPVFWMMEKEHDGN